MTTGLILEGGGMRGIFAAGVTDYFLDHRITFQHVIGVSAGACHGCSYVCGQRSRAFAVNTDYLKNKEYAGLRSLRKTGDYFGTEFIYHKIPDQLYPIDNETFVKSGVKFQAVVTNCITGLPEYPIIKDMKKDVEYIRASSSLPLLANMVKIQGKFYMDGGISDSIPVMESEAQGNEKNVIILTRERNYRKKINRITPLMALKYKEYPELIKAMARRHRIYNDTLDYIEELEEAGQAFVIAPMGPLDIGRTEKNKEKLRRGYQEGYYVAEGLSKKLEAFLG